jgi:hypothetical protein
MHDSASSEDSHLTARALLEAQDQAQELFAAVVASGLIAPGKLESELSREIFELARAFRRAPALAQAHRARR